MAEPLLERLPPVYVAALLLEAAGVDERGIAARLDMPRESVPTLLQLARAKLATVLSA